MNAITPKASMTEALRAEASQEPDAVHTGPVKKETQVIAIYGKGGMARASRWPTSAT